MSSAIATWRSDLNFAHLIDAHVKSGANVTMVYERAEIAKPITDGQLYVYDGRMHGRVTEIRWNDYRHGCAEPFHGRHRDGPRGAHCHGKVMRPVQNLHVPGAGYSWAPSLKILHVQGYEYSGYRARIYDIKSYFDENMRLLCPENVGAAVPHRAPCIHQGARRGALCATPWTARYSRCIVADGCIIEGEVENCVLFRGVKVSQGCEGEKLRADAGHHGGTGTSTLDYIVTDKNVHRHRRHAACAGNSNRSPCT